jgi:hypothetical protein
MISARRSKTAAPLLALDLSRIKQKQCTSLVTPIIICKSRTQQGLENDVADELLGHFARATLTVSSLNTQTVVQTLNFEFTSSKSPSHASILTLIG